MKLDRDVFAITFDNGKSSVEGLKSIVRKAGYTSSAATEENASRTRGFPSGKRSDDPLISRALARAQAENKIVVLDFQAVWCVPCKRMEQETFADPAVVQLLQQTVFLQVDTDEYPELAKQFGVVGLPDIRFLAPDGKELLRMTDFQDAQLFGETLGRILDRTSDAPIDQ